MNTEIKSSSCLEILEDIGMLKFTIKAELLRKDRMGLNDFKNTYSN